MFQRRLYVCLLLSFSRCSTNMATELKIQMMACAYASHMVHVLTNVEESNRLN